MILIDEAIDHFKYGISHDIFKPPITRYANLAVIALEKMKPVLVSHKKTFWKYYHYCPSCSSQLEKEGLNFCPNCGQKLCWDNYWEGLK
jgi:hypothetical protein